MVCPVRGDWIVPRRLMCFLFWTGTVLLFAGILLVVTSKHKGQTFLSWGGILLGVGACVLLSCLVLCIHAYYVIAETRSTAEHTLINNLQLQRKALSSHSRSISMDEVDVDRSNVYTTLGHDHDPKPSSNGGSYAGSLLKHRATDQTPDSSASARCRPPSSQGGRGGGGGRGEREMGDRTTCQGDGDGRLSADSMAISSESRQTPVYTISQAVHDVVFSPSSLHGVSYPFASSSSSPPTYSQLSASRAINSSSSGSRVIASSGPPPPPFQEGDRTDDRPKGEKSSLGSLNSRSARGSAEVLDSGSSEWRKGQRLRGLQNNAEVVNSSSQSSAPNSSFEVELDTTDQETPGGGPPGARGRRLNNTPVDRGGAVDSPCGLPSESVLARRPGRLNLDGGGGGDSWQTAPSGTRSDGERPITPGSRRFAGAESITRPFGLGTVTVTPLYRPQKTPPSRRHQEVILDVTSRDFDARRAAARTPDSHRATPVRTPDSMKSFRPPERRPVPHMPAPPYPHDREPGISVCQSDVTVYDNVIDSVRV